MKKSLLLLILVLWILCINPATAQQVLFKNQLKDSVTRSNPRVAAYEYVPGEIIVKFKDNVSVKSTGAKLKSASTVTNAIQAKYNVQKVEALFPGEKQLKSAQMLTAPYGQKFLRPSLHNIYKLKIADEKQLMNAINDFKADSANVAYAEPNYIISICNDKPIGPILTAADVEKMQQTKTDTSFKAGNGPIVNDPLYSQQWYIPAVKADLVWPQTKGDSTQVIAILDTGVDWLHLDLKNKIWKNKAEIYGNGRDDDGNGFIDDIRGWDFINNRNNPLDDNSHGTHVAGIAAAETNNEIGIAGVCPNAKIMPIKVFDRSGYGDITTIARGINYAATNGATIINMSFGTFARSLTMEDALVNAYSTCVLVAAAGNSALCIGPNTCSDSRFGLVSYPAGLPYVLGVQADGDYSNYDPDGPIHSEYIEGYNYELKAPGTALSTTPGGNYRVLAGTSMACPIISGLAALYRSKLPSNSTEMLWGDLIHSSPGFVDAYKSLFSQEKNPVFDLVEFSVNDTLLDCDRDGQPDAGETIQIIVKVRNTFGLADSVIVSLKKDIYADNNDVTIQSGDSFLGSLSSYASNTNKNYPFLVHINKSVKNSKNIYIDVLMQNRSNGEIFKQSINFKVYNGEELSGLLSKDTILTADKLWLINSSLRIATGVKMKLEPGTHLQINAGVDNRGLIEAIGTIDNRIKIEGTLSGSFTLEYVDLDLRKNSFSGNAKHCNFYNGISICGNFEYCSFTDFIYDHLNWGWHSAQFDNCYFKNFTANYLQGSSKQSVFENFYIGELNNFQSKFSVFNKIGNSLKFYVPFNPSVWARYPGSLFPISSYGQGNQIYKNSFINNDETSYIVSTTGNEDAVTLPKQYWGSSDSLKIKKKYIDFWYNASKPFFFYKPLLIEPSDSCHAHVWKILVNGKDAQDESVEPVGVGKQRFDVYFNRQMDKSITPLVSFGVRVPYNQQAVNEDGFWSTDGRIYTAYKTIKLTTGDGINRIRVSGAKEVNGWEWAIPVEDMRFNFLISAASSASTGFIAMPGLGKVKLEWNNNNLLDGLGFNMYRMEHINDTVLTKPLLVNASLIIDTLYTDFSGTPNKKYYYFYKVVRTDFSESDSSKVVSAIPFTATKGDANGDIKTDVLDIISIVSYLLGQNPTPFIFEAADVNADLAVNVLDVVSVANIIKGPKSALVTEGKKYNPTLAYITLKPEIIQLKSDAQVQAVQFELQGVDLEKVKLSAAIKGFELAYSIDSNKIKGVLYNLNGQTIPAGITDVIKIEVGAGSLTWGEVFGADPQGQYVTILKKVDVSLATETSPFGLSVQPNPSGSDMHIGFTLPETAKVTVKVFNLLGEIVSQVMDNTLPAGNQQVIWNGTNGNGEIVKPGVYFIRVEAKGEKNQTIKENIKVVRL